MKKILLVMVIIVSLSILSSCEYYFDKLIGVNDLSAKVIGIWKYPDDTGVVEFREDWTFTFSESIDNEVIDTQIGTWYAEDNILTFVLEKDYNSTTGKLEPVNIGEPEVFSYTIGVNENKLAFLSLIGENEADINSLIGTWYAFIDMINKKETETSSYLGITFNFYKDNTYELINYEYSNDGDDSNDIETTQTGIWEYDGTILSITDDNTQETLSGEVYEVGATLVIGENIFIGDILDRVE